MGWGVVVPCLLWGDVHLRIEQWVSCGLVLHDDAEVGTAGGEWLRRGEDGQGEGRGILMQQHGAAVGVRQRGP